MPTAESITRAIKEACDIVDIVGEHVALKASSGGYKGLCPFHQEKTPSFHVRPNEQYFKCFGCGAGGDVFKFVQQLHSVPFLEARQLLADRAGIAIRTNDQEKSGPSRAAVLRVNRWAKKVFERNLTLAAGDQARKYIDSRGLSQETAEAFGMGLAVSSFDAILQEARKADIPQSLLQQSGLIRTGRNGKPYDAFRNRLMFPIFDAGDQVIGFGGRTLEDDPAKYINSPETVVFDKKTCLFGINRAKTAFSEKKRAIIVEGYTDVLMAHQFGFEETVAALGTALTDQHLSRLCHYVPQIMLVFDADGAGMRAAQRAIEIALRYRVDVHVAHTVGHKDPCDFLLANGAAAFEELLISAPSALEFKWRQVLRSHSQEQAGTQAQEDALRDFVGSIATLDQYGQLDAIQRGLLVNQLSKLLGTTQSDVTTLLESEVNRQDDRRDLRVQNATAEPTQSIASVGRSVEDAVMTDILKALICEPGLYDRVAHLFDGQVISDLLLRRIAETVSRLGSQLGEFSLGELLAEFEDQETARRIVSIAEDGRAVEDWCSIVEQAIQRLTMLTGARGGKEKRHLNELQTGMHNYSGFAGIRKFTTRPCI